jgi:rod shape determining protein RodA
MGEVWLVFLDKRMLRHLDKLLFLAMAALIGVGLVAVSSAALGGFGPEDGHLYVIKQGLAAGIGLVLVVGVLIFDYEEMGRLSLVIYGVNVALLVAVLAIGKATNGAQSWIPVGPLQLQPSELGKVMLILTLGHHLSRLERLEGLRDLVLPALHVAPIAGLVLLQNDFGTAMVMVVITAAMVYMAGFPGWKMWILGGVPIGAFAAWFYAHFRWGISMWPLQDYQVDRLKVFIDPASDPTNRGYQVMQSKIAIGSGGLTGRGLYQGVQNQLGYLPEQHTDFIFSVIAEEMGLAGGCAVLALYLLLFWRIMAIGAGARDRYGALVCTGVSAMIGFHVLENIGMTMGVMPVTGIPLPFLSYGGSSMMANMLAIGLVLNVGMRRQTLEFH